MLRYWSTRCDTHAVVKYASLCRTDKDGPTKRVRRIDARAFYSTRTIASHRDEKQGKGSGRETSHHASHVPFIAVFALCTPPAVSKALFDLAPRASLGHTSMAPLSKRRRRESNGSLSSPNVCPLLHSSSLQQRLRFRESNRRCRHHGQNVCVVMNRWRAFSLRRPSTVLPLVVSLHVAYRLPTRPISYGEELASERVSSTASSRRRQMPSVKIC